LASSRRPRFHALRVQDLVLQVHLGCSAEERAKPQEVRVTLEFRFTEPPGGAVSDKIEEALCYAEVCTAVRRLTDSSEYCLIERLASEIYGVAAEMAGPAAQTAVRVHKVRPPVADLSGGSVYVCGDFAL
jgi:dihydroneopterin aldolase